VHFTVIFVHTLLLFNPTSLDEVCVQATHIERRGKNVQEDPTKKPSKFSHNQFKGKFKRKEKKTVTKKKGEGNPSCTHCKRDGHDDEHCWKLHMEKIPTLGWVWDKEKINVTKQCRVRFSITSKLVDEVYLDVVSLDICGIVLGSPYLYERKAVFFHNENKYHLTKGRVEYIVRAHNMKVNTTLVSAGQMKRLINTNNIYVLMVVREKDVGTSDAFQGCDPSHKKELIDSVSNYDEIF
jgi:hypothetical protein